MSSRKIGKRVVETGVGLGATCVVVMLAWTTGYILLNLIIEAFSSNPDLPMFSMVGEDLSERIAILGFVGFVVGIIIAGIGALIWKLEKETSK